MHLADVENFGIRKRRDAIVAMYENFFKERMKRSMAETEGIDRPPQEVVHRLGDHRWVNFFTQKFSEVREKIFLSTLERGEDSLLDRHFYNFGKKLSSMGDEKLVWEESADGTRKFMYKGEKVQEEVKAPQDVAVRTAEVFPWQLYATNDDSCELRFFRDIEVVGWPDLMFVPSKRYVEDRLRAELDDGAGADSRDLSYMTVTSMSKVRAAVEKLAKERWVQKISPAFVSVDMPDGCTALHVKLLCRTYPTDHYWKKHPRAMYDRMYWLTEDDSNIWNCKASFKADDYEGVRHTDKPATFMVKKNNGGRWSRFMQAKGLHDREMYRRGKLKPDELEFVREMDGQPIYDDSDPQSTKPVVFTEDVDEFLDQIPADALDERYVYPESPARMLDYDILDWRRSFRNRKRRPPPGLLPPMTEGETYLSAGSKSKVNWLPAKSRFKWRAIKPDNYKMNLTDPWYNEANRESNRYELKQRYSHSPEHPLYNQSPCGDETVRAFYPWMEKTRGFNRRRDLMLQAHEEMGREVPWYMKGVDVEEIDDTPAQAGAPFTKKNNKKKL